MTDKIITHPATNAYRDGYDRIFGKKDLSEKTLEDVLIELASISQDQRSKLFIRPIGTTFWRPYS